MLIVFNGMIADMESNKTLSPKVTEFLIRGTKLNILLNFISQSYFKVKLNATHYFIVKFFNKRKPQQITSNHSSDNDFKDFMKLHKDYTKEPYLLLVNDITLSTENSLRFRKNLL